MQITNEEREVWLEKISKMTQFECANLHRFAPPGHPIFDNRNNLYSSFKKRFDEVGGMTPEVSKAIGW